MARNRLFVSPDGPNWKVTFERRVLSRHTTKEAAEDAARTIARANEPSQVLVPKQDGTFESEWTYGDDPYLPAG